MSKSAMGNKWGVGYKQTDEHRAKITGRPKSLS